MLRFIIDRQFRDIRSGIITKDYKTVDIDVPELEMLLNDAHYSNNGYLYHKLVGVELLNNKNIRTVIEE